MTDVDLEKLANRIALQTEALRISPVYTREQVMGLVGKNSQTALDRWLKTFAPKARCGQGRYTKAAIHRGLQRESRGKN